ncbi:hypothetical protein ACFO5X_08305 [Seohaeicola nanhaiensis]|uniref:Uncharacterized protein n=1 Tax=Seohaeicola nanhaiensis TaxID=1387282 RepID=A0ABV9KEG1_9RHOB
MYGVVLWSDNEDRNAVIWCEDHGELAFCRQEDRAQSVDLDAGDWIQFDLDADRHQRIASNPRLVAEGLFGGLADQLELASMPPGAGARRASAEVIPLCARGAERRRWRDDDSFVGDVLAQG